MTEEEVYVPLEGSKSLSSNGPTDRSPSAGVFGAVGGGVAIDGSRTLR